MNVWHLAKKVMNLLEEGDVAEFDVDEKRTTNTFPATFNGVLIDSDKNEYEINDREKLTMFKEMMETQDLEFEVETSPPKARFKRKQE